MLFTIGHSNRSPEEFVGMLKENGVTAIADVRSQPYSRHMPHFNREPLQALSTETQLPTSFWATNWARGEVKNAVTSMGRPSMS